MNLPWNFAPPLLAFLTLVVTTQLAIVLAGAFRSRDYRRFEDWSAKRIGKEFRLPALAPSLAEERRNSFQPLLRELQQTANGAQTAYHNAVVRSAACLALGFAVTAAESIGNVSWDGIFGVQAWESFLNWTDTFALLSVLIIYVHATSLYRPWIIKRAETELVRQYQYLSVMFPDIFPSTAKRAMITGTLVQREAKDRHLGRLVNRIEESWQKRKLPIEEFAAEQPQLDQDALITYLRKRALRQFGWFTDSIARLEYIAGRRKHVLLALYLLSTALAFAQMIWFTTDPALSIVRAILLFITGLSLAMTAYYTNQNLGSIVHRYNGQQRDIHHWLREIFKRLNDNDAPHHPYDSATTKLICTHIVAFEELMIYELIDWINISSHDVIELG